MVSKTVYLFLFIEFFLEIKYSYAAIKDSVADEQSLINFLFEDGKYLKTVRPSELVEIEISMSIRQIVSIDEKNQIMTSNGYFSLMWNDTRLDWDVLERPFPSINVPVTKVWVPDIVVVNSANSNGFFTLNENMLVTIESSGMVTILLSAINLQTRCKIMVEKFPFDTQICPIIIGSWAQSLKRLVFHSDEGFIDNSSYIENPVWQLTDYEIQNQNTTQRSPFKSKLEMEDIYFYFELKRRPLFIMMNGIFPCLVLNLVSLLSYAMPFPSQIALSNY